MSLITGRTDVVNGFDLNTQDDGFVMQNVHGTWARFSVVDASSTSFGNAVVSLYGSLDPAASGNSFFEIDAAQRISGDYGMTGPILITAIPTLKLIVTTPQGSQSAPSVGFVIIEP
jgi:hypothetical protein